MGGGALVAKALTAQVVGRPLVNLELHGADLLGAREDGLEALAKHQPDLRVSVESKARVLRSVVEQLRGEGYRFVTLFEAARVSMAAEA
jgi:hypothetical protein